MTWGKAKGREVSDPGFPCGSEAKGKRKSSGGNGNKYICLLTFWPRFKPPLHHNMFLRDLK